MSVNFSVTLKRKLAYALLRLVQLARIIFFKSLSTTTAEGQPVLHQPAQLVGLGTIRFGKNVNVGVFPSPFYVSSYAYIEARNASASVQIGDDTFINNNFVAIAEHLNIQIGRRVKIGSNVEIYDSDFHGLERSQRQTSNPDNARSVCIGDEVFVGSNVRILKGVSIGEGAVIANGSVVVRDIPENVIAGGIPAVVIRSL